MHIFIVLLALAAASPTAAPQAAHAPIAVEQCSASYGSGSSTMSTDIDAKGQYERKESTTLGSGPKLSISFTNESTKPVKDVLFTLVQNDREVAHQNDSGKFSPGVRINHKFKLPAEISPLGLSTLRCDVQSVRFADGTTWSKAAQ